MSNKENQQIKYFYRPRLLFIGILGFCYFLIAMISTLIIHEGKIIPYIITTISPMILSVLIMKIYFINIKND